MKDMDKAVRIETAIENQERILVFGDYDVDGTTAVSFSSYLKKVLS
jgi:single-stranded-DNA-specific exonuclease